MQPLFIDGRRVMPTPALFRGAMQAHATMCDNRPSEDAAEDEIRGATQARHANIKLLATLINWLALQMMLDDYSSTLVIRDVPAEVLGLELLEFLKERRGTKASPGCCGTLSALYVEVRTKRGRWISHCKRSGVRA